MTRTTGLLLFGIATGSAVTGVACTSSDTFTAPDASTHDAGALDATAFDASVDSSQDSAPMPDAAPRDSASDARPSCANLAMDAALPIVCSDAGAEAGLVVNNGCAESLDLWWVDFACTEEFYQTIDPGGSAAQDSFVTHPWRLRLADGGRVVKEIPPLAGGVTTVNVP